MSTASFQQLKAIVIAQSYDDDWYQACREWVVTNIDYSEDLSGVCVCGQTGLHELYTIHNNYTGAYLSPIGSKCINHFGQQSMDDDVDYLRSLLQLSTLSYSQQTFDYARQKEGPLNRKFLQRLLDEDVFEPSGYNDYDSDNDVHFLLRMFNARTDLSDARTRKADVLVRGLVRWSQRELKAM